ncbi:MAG: glycosyltransferase family 2 protein [Cytophagaceae bacterium]
MQTGISVLIPVYRENPTALLNQLLELKSTIRVPLEIIVADDGSNEHYYQAWSVNFRDSEIQIFHTIKNLGRSAIRNFLWSKSSYTYRLFLDGDTFPIQKDFLQIYEEQILNNPFVIYGGTYYRDIIPSKEKSLRYYYGVKREALTVEQRNAPSYHHFTINNVLCHYTVFEPYPFKEEINGYGHEDTLLGMELRAKNVSVLQIENGVYHDGLDNNDVFLFKTEEGINNLVSLYQQGKIDNSIRLIQTYEKLKSNLAGRMTLSILKSLRKTFRSAVHFFPSCLFFFDVFKLAQFTFRIQRHEH